MGIQSSTQKIGQFSDALDMEVFLADGEKIGARELGFFSQADDRNNRAEAKEDLLVLTARPGVSCCRLRVGKCKQGVLPAAQLLQDSHTLERILTEQGWGLPVRKVQGARKKPESSPFLQG